MPNINEVLRQTIKIIKAFDHQITREELQMYGLTTFIRSVRYTNSTNTDVLFDFGRYIYDPSYKDTGIIKVSYDLLWYIYSGGNIKFNTNYTKEEIFQQSTIHDYYDLELDIAENIKELISLLEHLWVIEEQK